MTTETVNEIVLTADDTSAADTFAPKIYDPNFTYATIQPAKASGKRKVDIDVTRVVRQYFADNSKVRRLSIPLTLSARRRDRSAAGDDLVTAAEIRNISRTGRGCSSAIVVGTSTGMRIQKHRVMFSRPQSTASFRPGRSIMATLAVEEGCLFAFAENRSSHKNVVLIYRLDSIANWPADALSDDPKLTSSLCVGNLSLAGIYDVDNLKGIHRYIDPSFEEKVLSARRTANDMLRRLVDAAVNILKNRATMAYHEYFAPTHASNTKHTFFGDETSTLQTVPTTPDRFLTEVFSGIAAYRRELAEEATDWRAPTLACGMTYTLSDDGSEVDVQFSLPKHGNVVLSIATTLTDMPEDWSEESSLRLKQKDFADMISAIKANSNGTLKQKLFVGD